MDTEAPPPPQPGKALVSLDSITDLDQAWRVAQAISQSTLVPHSLQNKPANVLLLALTGRDLGLSFAQSVRALYSPGDGQVGMRSSLMLARLHEAGHTYRWEFNKDGHGCTFWIKRNGKDPEFSASFTVDDALAAGLVTRNDSGQLVARSRDNRPKPWELYEQDLLFARAASRTVNRAAPEVTLGMEVLGPEVPQREEVQLQPGPGREEPAGFVQPADEASPQVAAELAGMDAQGLQQGLGAQPAAGEAAPTPAPPPPAPSGAPPAATTGRAGTARPPAGDGHPRATQAQMKAVTDRFGELGWDARKEEGRLQILVACTMWCRRHIGSAADLSGREATGLANALSKVMRTNAEDHYLVALGEAVEAWARNWEESDPDSYEREFPSAADSG